MPIYEYRRPDGTTFELQQSFSDDPLEVDPDTGVPVERVMHPPAVHFKGKGFYNTDYGTRNRQRETAAAAEGSSSKDSSKGDSSESKGDSAGSSSESKPKGDGAKEPAKSKDTKPAASKSG
ncbi:MAG TPA: zinc ribbon domain-containing protein [Solirubrobacteraceae bacterium]|jgi:putative FmdB family regulatory protein|nr:zinc ribbon domain-containing protein [Solirubrobacteraceae bacterium]